MSTQQTPGPWTDCENGYVIAGPLDNPNAPSCPAVAQVLGTTADARLIAEAPAMAALIRRMLARPYTQAENYAVQAEGVRILDRIAGPHPRDILARD